MKSNQGFLLEVYFLAAGHRAGIGAMTALHCDLEKWKTSRTYDDRVIE